MWIPTAKRRRIDLAVLKPGVLALYCCCECNQTEKIQWPV